MFSVLGRLVNETRLYPFLTLFDNIQICSCSLRSIIFKGLFDILKMKPARIFVYSLISVMWLWNWGATYIGEG
jgi:hypothetical protein